MDWLVQTLSATLLIAGALFVLIGGVGVVRMPDVYTRLHAASLTDTLGAILILLGLMVLGGFSLMTVKLILILLFLLLTSPTASHALAKAALSDKVKPLLASDLNATESSSSTS